MSHHEKVDIAIIGAGSGGLSIAAVAAQLGLSVALIEKNKMGGDCLNTGCIPSKSFLAAATAAHHFTDSDKFGIMSQTPQVDFNNVIQHVNKVIAAIAPHDSIERFTQLGAKVYLASASFIDKNTIKAGDHIIQAKRIVIATGSSPFIPPIPGLSECRFHTNETIFELNTLPKHLIVIGGGPIGCELAQGFAFLGSSVTLLEAFTMMPKDDPELVKSLKNELERSGITIHEHCQIKLITQNNHETHVTFEINRRTQKITGSHLLLATGRKANVEQLNLEKANVNSTPKGIDVDKHLRTSNKRIYVIGDAAGSYQFTHIANYQAGIVIQHAIFKLPVSARYYAVPWVTYTSPPLAHVGMTYQEAKKHYPKALCLKLSFEHNDRAQTELAASGQIKVTVLPNGRILGASILSKQADELILPWIMLITNKQKLRELTRITIPYPTLNEISKRLASEFYSKQLYSKTVRWLAKLFIRI